MIINTANVIYRRLANGIRTLSKALTLLLLLTAAAEAGLVRGGGGSVQQDTDVNYIYLMPDSNIVAEGLVSDLSNYVSTRSLSSSTLPIFGTPPDLCYHDTYFTEDGQFRTSCRWEFALGEMIALEGAVTTHLAGSITEFFWSIVGPDQTWTFTGDDVVFDGTNVFLNVEMPDDLAVGSYRLDFSFRQIAPEGHFFLYRERFDTGGCYDEAGEVCGHFGDFSESLFWTTSESFTVVAVPTPTSLLLLLTGAAWLVRRRKR